MGGRGKELEMSGGVEGKEREMLSWIRPLAHNASDQAAKSKRAERVRLTTDLVCCASRRTVGEHCAARH